MHRRLPSIYRSLQRELKYWRLWSTRLAVLGFACLAGWAVVALTWVGDKALRQFDLIAGLAWWTPLLWTPLCTAAIVWCTRRYAAAASGSGIPQVMAALSTGPENSARFVSMRLSLSKLLLTTWGLLAGLSLGREGPSVQVAAGVMHSTRHWLPKKDLVSDHGLMIAGGATGIAAAFNTPLGGILFAIEELTRSPEQRSNGLIMASIALGGLMAVSVFGNATYFGLIRVDDLTWTLWGPGLLVVLVSGLAGGVFSRLLVLSLANQGNDWCSRLRRSHPVAFAAACGLVVALIGVLSQGATFGSGYGHTRALLEGGQTQSALFVPLKYVATWLTTWSGVPGGIFAPCLALGAALGKDIADLTAHPHVTTLIALGMVAFLAAVTQAPMTAFVIVMEMVNGHALVLSLMAASLLASGLARLVSAPLYPALADLQLHALAAHTPAPTAKEAPP